MQKSFSPAFRDANHSSEIARSPSSSAGTRVPHLWLERRSQRISTLDLLDGRFVLLTGSHGTSWCQAAGQTALEIPLAAYRIGPGGDLVDPEQQWAQRMGVSSYGAVLVRPDGFEAWRSSRLTPTPEHQLEEALSRILCRPTALTGGSRSERQTANWPTWPTPNMLSVDEEGNFPRSWSAGPRQAEVRVFQVVR